MNLQKECYTTRDYLLALKENHEIMRKEIEEFFDQIKLQKECKYIDNETFYEPIKFDYSETIEKNGGRIESRCYWTSSDIQWFADKEKWDGLTSFIMVECTREIGNKKSCERRYYVTGLKADAKTLGIISRKHWSIENSLHYVLDVIFKEDESRGRPGLTH